MGGKRKAEERGRREEGGGGKGPRGKGREPQGDGPGAPYQKRQKFNPLQKLHEEAQRRKEEEAKKREEVRPLEFAALPRSERLSPPAASHWPALMLIRHCLPFGHCLPFVLRS